MARKPLNPATVTEDQVDQLWQSQPTVVQAGAAPRGRDYGVTIGGGKKNYATDPQAYAIRKMQAVKALNYNAPLGSKYNFYGIDPDSPVYPTDKPGAWYLDTDGIVKQIPEMNGAGGIAGNFVRSIGRGMGLGSVLNQADAATNAALAPAIEPLMRLDPNHNAAYDLTKPNDNGTFQSRYDAALRFQNQMDQSMDVAHPLLSAGGKATGAVMGGAALGPYMTPLSSSLPEGAGLGTRVLAGSGDGAIVGGSLGYASGHGGLNDPSRFNGARQGATWGALGGGFAPLGVRAGENIFGYGDQVLDRLRNPVVVGDRPNFSSATSASPLADAVDEHLAGGGGVPAPPTVTVKPAAARRAYDRIASGLRQQGVTPAQAIQQARDLGPQGMLADTGAPLRDLGRAAVEAPGQGRQLAQGALDQRQLGVQTGGFYTAPPSSQRISNGLSDALHDYADGADVLGQGQSAAQPLYQQALGAPSVPRAAFNDLAASPYFQDAYDRARATSQSQFLHDPTPANDSSASPANDGDYGPIAPAPRIAPLPTQMPGQLNWRTLHMMNEALDGSARQAGMGGPGAADPGALRDYANQFSSRLSELNPAYGAARNAFPGMARASDALDAGYGFNGSRPDQIRQAFGAMSPSEQQLYRYGAAQAEANRLGDLPTTADVSTAAGYDRPTQMQRLQAVFPDDASYGDYMNLLKRENTMFGTRRRVLDGLGPQPTGEPDGDPMAILNAGRSLLGDPGGKGWQDVLKLMLKSPAEQKLDANAAYAVSGALFNPNVSVGGAVQDSLDAALRRQALADALRRVSTVGGVVGGAEYGAQQPAP